MLFIRERKVRNKKQDYLRVHKWVSVRETHRENGEKEDKEKLRNPSNNTGQKRRGRRERRSSLVTLTRSL